MSSPNPAQDQRQHPADLYGGGAAAGVVWAVEAGASAEDRELLGAAGGGAAEVVLPFASWVYS